LLTIWSATDPTPEDRGTIMEKAGKIKNEKSKQNIKKYRQNAEHAVNEKNNEENKKKGKKRIVLILVMIFIIIFLVSGVLIYFNNKTFKTKVNGALSNVPEFIGSHFGDQPTEENKEEMRKYMANYYLSLEADRAADKLYVVKKDNEGLFNDIIKTMNDVSSAGTESILKLIRNMDLRKNSLSSIYDEIRKDEKSQLEDEISRFEDMDTYLAINEIERRCKEDGDFAGKLPQMLKYMDEDKAGEILYYIDEGIRNEILSGLDQKSRGELESLMLKEETDKNKYADLSKLYELRPVDVCVKEIGNTDTYSIEELADIYLNLSIKKSSDILSRVEDEDFMKDILSAVRKEEQLQRREQNVAEKMSEGIKFISEYNKKIDELVEVYKKMDPSDVGNILESMMGNNKTVTKFEVDSTPVFEISDSTIVLDVLGKMKKSAVSEILGSMSAKNAAELTQMLAKP